FFFSSRRRHTRWPRDWSSDVCSSDLLLERQPLLQPCQQLGRRQQLYARGGKLDGQRQPIQPPTDRRHRLGVLAAEVKARAVRLRSEERRVGKECRCRWGPDQYKKEE